MSRPSASSCINETEEAERDHLEQVIGHIEAELRAFSDRLNFRLSESREMAIAIQEQKRDMDHAEKANMRQAVNVLSRINEHGLSHHEKLIRLSKSPYFGRIDLAAEDGGADQAVYIGLYSFADPKTVDQIVHDWRAPISGMFYDFELGEAHFEAPSGRQRRTITRKRQYQIERGTLKLMLETSLSIQDDILREQLSRASDDAMKNIVATIQREQNEIIRNDRSHTLIIQGAAGSGKTSIALHRIAFLLYRFREDIRSNDILIVSPNRIFGHYISQVLPELGEEMIQETTMEAVAGTLLGPKHRFQTFAEQVACLLDGKDERYAERVRLKASAEYLAKLDAFIARFRVENVTPVDINIPPYTVDRAWIADRLSNYRPLPIGEQITRTAQDIVEYMQTMYQKEVKGKERTAIRAQLKGMFKVTTLAAVYRSFHDSLDHPNAFKKMKDGRLEYCDVFPMIYLSRLIESLPPLARIKHVVIDEMQDYTPIQYRLIDMLFPCRKTILGDRNQSVSPLSSSNAEAIRDVLRDAECMYMHRSYRSTIEITQVAQCIQPNLDLQPIDRHGERPTLSVCADGPAEIEVIRKSIEAFRASEHNTIGIICRTDADALALHDAIKSAEHEIQLMDARSTTFGGGVMIATAFLAKGLEFDRVIVPGCGDEAYRSTIDRHMLYVACTRAMHLLTLTCTGKPSRLLQEAIDRGVLDVA